jgi:mannose-1-phosphate guanylyltransferase
MSLSPNTNHRWAVVLAGGDGTPLQELTYPISGDARPKQFCDFFGGKSPLGLAFAFCLHVIAQRDEDALVSFFPSDHYYSNSCAFRESIESGLRLMEKYPDCILILGAEARNPEVGYGWIQPGRTLVDSLVNPLLRVSRFLEKPALKRAEVLKRRGCLWNTFITIGLVGAFMDLLQATVPRLTRLLADGFMKVQIDQLYGRLAPVGFSRAVLTRMPGRLVVLRDAASGWTDFGSPRRAMDVFLSQGIRPPWLNPRRADGGMLLQYELA